MAIPSLRNNNWGSYKGSTANFNSAKQVGITLNSHETVVLCTLSPKEFLFMIIALA